MFFSRKKTLEWYYKTDFLSDVGLMAYVKRGMLSLVEQEDYGLIADSIKSRDDFSASHRS